MAIEDLSPLLARCALRDQNAMQELYNKTSAKLYALVLGIVKHRDTADDVLQEAYMNVWLNANQYRPDKSSAVTWISTIVRNRALDRLRAIKRNPLLQNSQLDDIADTPLASEQLTPTDFADISADLQSLTECLSGLEPQQQHALLLSYYHGYSHQELAAKLTAPLGTVKGWIRRGLEKLQQCLGAV